MFHTLFGSPKTDSQNDFQVITTCQNDAGSITLRFPVRATLIFWGWGLGYIACRGAANSVECLILVT